MAKNVKKMMKKGTDLYDLTNNKWCNLEEFIKEKTIVAKERLWIVSPFIANSEYLKETFHIKELKTRENFDFRILTDIKCINSCSPKNILKSLCNCKKLKTLDKVHAKIYIIDDTAVITSANMTKKGFCERYEAGVANIDIKKCEELFMSYWNKAKEIEKNKLEEQFKKVLSISTKLPVYENFLNSFKNLADKYRKLSKKNYDTKTLYFEIDDFLNYLYHRESSISSKKFKNENNVQKKEEISIEKSFAEYKNWQEQNAIKEKEAVTFFNSNEKQQETAEEYWNTVVRRKYTQTNVDKLFLSKQFNELTLEKIAEFLRIHMNTYRAMGNIKKWPEKFCEENNLEEVKKYIQCLINCKDYNEAEQIIKKRNKKKVKYLGSNTSYELLGFFENDFPIRNGNTNAGLRFFGYNVSNCK